MGAKRSVGVTLSAIVTIFGSVLVILGAVSVVFAASFQSDQPSAPPFMKAFLWVLCLVMLGFAAWGITTGVGLLRLGGWSRWSMLVFSVLLVLFGGGAAFSAALVQFPATPAVRPQMMLGIKFGLVGFYSVLALLGAFWLFYFNDAGVRAQFGTGADAEGAQGPGGRPLSVSIISWFLLMGAAICLGGALLPFPAMALGLMVTGWAARVVYLLLAGFELWLGLGLLRLQPLSRILAMAFFVYTAVNAVLFAGLPGYSERMRAALEILPAAMRGGGDSGVFDTARISMLLGGLFNAVPIWFLIARREAFKASEPR